MAPLSPSGVRGSPLPVLTLTLDGKGQKVEGGWELTFDLCNLPVILGSASHIRSLGSTSGTPPTLVLTTCSLGVMGGGGLGSTGSGLV